MYYVIKHSAVGNNLCCKIVSGDVLQHMIPIIFRALV